MVLRRLLLGIFTVWVVTVVIFASTEMLPGDVASAILGQYATPETLQSIRVSLGLDRPAILRYGEWLVDFLRGDFGTSLANHRPLAPLIAQRLGNTVLLAGVAASIAVPLALLLGIVAAIHRDRLLDRALSAVTLACVSVPEFFIGYILIIVLARLLGLFPSLAQVPPGAGLLETLQAIALPVITLVLVVTAHMMRMTRAALIAVLSSSYVEMARLKGMPDWRIILRHALPNAISPIANVVAFSLAYLVIGVIIVETVFVYPGIGQLMVDAVAARDVPTVQACGLIFGVTYVALNLLADLVSMVSNPRQRLPR